jgi:ubiquinone/menaquinone biosynthesis C-methylase UbiE
MDEPGEGFDADRATRFAEGFMATLNAGALCLMCSIGHRAGLFDTMRALSPATSEQIAAAAGLNERYVREWLGAMVTARVVDVVDTEKLTFRLPPEHASVLTRAAGADNLAVFAQYVGLLGGVEDDIVECFHRGGGVPYDRYPRFHAVMAEDSGQSVLSCLESHIVPVVAGLHDRLVAGIDVLDVGCGQGRVILRLAELYPNSRFQGIDLSAEALGHARAAAADGGLTNVEFIAQDLSDFDRAAPVAAFDLTTTFDAIHDQGQPGNVLKGIHRALRADGVYLMQETKGSTHPLNNLDHPFGTFLYTVSCMHCMTVSLAQGGEGLGAMWGEDKTREYLALAGFRAVDKHELAHDIQNNWYVVTK